MTYASLREACGRPDEDPKQFVDYVKAALTRIVAVGAIVKFELLSARTRRSQACLSLKRNSRAAADIPRRLDAADCGEAVICVGRPGHIAHEFARDAGRMEDTNESARIDVMAALPTALLIDYRGGKVRWEPFAKNSWACFFANEFLVNMIYMVYIATTKTVVSVTDLGSLLNCPCPPLSSRLEA
jgi:hypothetical protein